MSQSHDALLRQAFELAQTNKRAEARQLILRVVTQDEENARAWMLLARITTDLDERRTALMNVVNLEPFNTKAQEALAELEGKLAISRAIGDTPEKRKSGRRVLRTFLFVLIGLMALIALGVVILVAVRNSQRSTEVAEITQFAVNLNNTQTAIALVANATETAVQQAIVDITSTYLAAPTATNTPRPTLPPENTATPTITPTPTNTRVAPPADLPGQIIGWGGRAGVAGETNFPVIFISVTDGSIRQVSGTNRGKHVTAVNTTRLVYERYFRDVFRSEISKLDPVTAISEAMSVEWDGTRLALGETAYPHFTLDGSLLVFVATSADTDTRDIYLFQPAAGGGGLRRLTNDGFEYDMPTISPDGAKIVAVRRDVPPNPPNPDLVMIDTASGVVEPWTGDGGQTVEAMPRWSPDGKLVAYVVINADGKGDIMLRNTEGMVNVIPVTRTTDVDEVYPVFSPDTRYLAYSSDFTEGYNIFIYDLLTNAFYQLTYDDEAYYPGAWVP